MPQRLKTVPSDTSCPRRGDYTRRWAQWASSASDGCKLERGCCQLKEPLTSNRTALQSCARSRHGPRRCDGDTRGVIAVVPDHPSSISLGMLLRPVVRTYLLTRLDLHSLFYVLMDYLREPGVLPGPWDVVRTLGTHITRGCSLGAPVFLCLRLHLPGLGRLSQALFSCGPL